MGGGGSKDPPPCEYGDWDPLCTASCKPEGHNPPLEQTQEAKEDPERCKPQTRKQDCTRDLPDCEYDCEYTWEEWGECLGTDGLRVDCGGGKRSRKPIWKRKPGKNTVCDVENRAYTEQCTTERCVSDCLWSGWGDWQECPLPCTPQGQTPPKQIRSRSVKTEARGGGKECEGKDVEERTCTPIKVCENTRQFAGMGEEDVYGGGGQMTAAAHVTQPGFALLLAIMLLVLIFHFAAAKMRK
mmetsp:Transcript_17332/g.41649  ORF Transcript_17332/g.41649 Transcript_17332/m.41649 type:complete len:241 (-) Transcript_17332:905-1627(-)